MDAGFEVGCAVELAVGLVVELAVGLAVELDPGFEVEVDVEVVVDVVCPMTCTTAIKQTATVAIAIRFIARFPLDYLAVMRRPVRALGAERCCERCEAIQSGRV